MNTPFKRFFLIILAPCMFLGCVFAGYALDDSTVGGLMAISAASLVTNGITGCGLGTWRRRTLWLP